MTGIALLMPRLALNLQPLSIHSVSATVSFVKSGFSDNITRDWFELKDSKNSDTPLWDNCKVQKKNFDIAISVWLFEKGSLRAAKNFGSSADFK